MSMTPETDDASALPRPMAYADGFVRLRALAYKLANERDEAILKLNLETRNANDAYMARAKATTERDAALAKLAKCREALEHIARHPHITATAMKDCAREALDATHLIPYQKES